MINTYICNNIKFITEYYKKSTKIGRLILDKILLGQRNIYLYLNLKREKKGIILDLKDIFFLPNNLSNLVSLS